MLMASAIFLSVRSEALFDTQHLETSLNRTQEQKRMPGFRWTLSFVLTCAFSLTSYADGPNFVADHIFDGKNLNSWKSVGAAQWKVENGEIVGTPDNSAGGWL